MKLRTPLDPIFDWIDHNFGRRLGFNHPLARWIRKFSRSHQLAGVLLQAGLGTVVVAVGGFLLEGGRVDWLVLLIGFVLLCLWFAALNSWYSRNTMEEED
jgi:hypothetical protein